jgi:hypothetical protein
MSKHLGQMFGVQTEFYVPQIDLSVCTDRKMVNLYVYLRNFTKFSLSGKNSLRLECNT